MSYHDQRVLVAEDEEGLRQVLSKQLELSGFAVDRAADGHEAISYLEANEYSVVVTDMRMPKANGLEVMRAAKHRWPLCEVIILTAYGSLENVLEAVRAGNLYDYLTKPLDDIRELSVVVERAVRTRQLHVQNRQLEAHLEAAVQRLQEGADELIAAGRQAGVGKLAETVVRGISTPLEAVQYLAEYATEKAQALSTDPAAEADKQHLILGLQRLETAARHSKRVLEALIRYTSPEQSVPVQVGVNAVLGDALLLLESELVQSRLTVKTNLNQDVPDVIAIPSRLQQVFVTLVMSAIEWTEPGGAVMVSTRREEGRPPRAVIEIADAGLQNGCSNGDAINPLEATTEQMRLSLAAAKSIVEDHGGRMICVSEPGQRNRVILRFPGVARERRPSPATKAA
ncbi:MAG: response regulator [Fimbriimonadia bacterium]|jgi:DNA-binding response OmpR family regulator